MKPVVQSRIGKNGTCFRACLASLLEIPERAVPDFKDANQDPGVDRFLRGYGLRYVEVPVERPSGNAPIGYHIITGLSPRGGQHAVVGKDGELAWDPHPVADDPRRGLAREENWGLLLPLSKTGEVSDMAERCGKPEWRTCPYCDGRIHRSECNVRLDPKKDCCKERGCPHSLLSAGKGTSQLPQAKDSEPPPYKPGDPIILRPNGKRRIVKSCTLAENLFHEPEWHVLTTTGEAITIPVLRPVPVKGK